MAYPRLRAALGLPSRPVRVYDLVQQLAVLDEDVLDRFGVDTIEMGRGFALSPDDWQDWTLPNGAPCQVPAWCVPQREPGRWVIRSASGRVLGEMPDGAWYFDQCYWPFFEKDDLDRIPEAMDECMWTMVQAPPGPLGSGPQGDQRLAEGARALRARTDRAIIGLFGGNLLELGQMLYRNDKFLTLMAAEPRRVHQFLTRLLDIHLGKLDRFLQLVGPYIDIILFGDDLGMQTGPQMSPRMYREFFKPRHSILFHRAKELAKVKVMLHSCGSLRALLPDLIEAGLDTVNPVQISCSGMDSRELKAAFGDRLTFWGGGCDTHQVLSFASPAEIRRHVREQVAILNPGGGFVFQQVHNILANVPAENIIAMFDAVQESN
jgi:uroporphyrinogen decarboxylase